MITIYQLASIVSTQPYQWILYNRTVYVYMCGKLFSFPWVIKKRFHCKSLLWLLCSLNYHTLYVHYIWFCTAIHTMNFTDWIYLTQLFAGYLYNYYVLLLTHKLLQNVAALTYWMFTWQDSLWRLGNPKPTKLAIYAFIVFCMGRSKVSTVL